MPNLIFVRGRGLWLAMLTVALSLPVAAFLGQPSVSVSAQPARPLQATATSIPTGLPPVETPTPVPTGLPPVETPTLVPTALPPTGNVCPHILRFNKVPQAAVNAAVANPRAVRGYNQPRDEGKPVGPYNPPRLWLSLHAYSKPYHPLFNSLEYKVGCP